MPQKKTKKRKSILYLGNKLSLKGRNVSTVEVLSSQLETEGYHVISGSSQNNPVIRLVAMLFMILKHQSKVSLLLIDTYSTTAFWYAYYCAKLAKALNLEYIPILHGGNLPQRLRSHPKQCQDLFCKAKFNVAPSKYLMHEFEGQGYDNLVFIPNSIEIENYVYKERSLLKPNLLWVRAFAHIYNPMLALKVLQKILETYPEAKLSMVGPFKDDSIEECKVYAKQHELPVTFTGGMPKADWLAYAKEFNVFINTTNVDNTPVSVIEAMALGLPVVSTNVGGIPYLLEDQVDALLVNPNEVKIFSEAVLDVLNNPDLALKRSRIARNKVEQFDWKVVKHKWDEVIAEK